MQEFRNAQFGKAPDFRNAQFGKAPDFVFQEGAFEADRNARTETLGERARDRGLQAGASSRLISRATDLVSLCVRPFILFSVDGAPPMELTTAP